MSTDDNSTGKIARFEKCFGDSCSFGKHDVFVLPPPIVHQISDEIIKDVSIKIKIRS